MVECSSISGLEQEVLEVMVTTKTTDNMAKEGKVETSNMDIIPQLDCPAKIKLKRHL